MSPREAIMEWLGRPESRAGVDILNADFVEFFIEKTGRKWNGMTFGAHKCPALGRELSKMYKDGLLTRYACGLSAGDASMGFPKWVYSYKLAAPSDRETVG